MSISSIAAFGTVLLGLVCSENTSLVDFVNLNKLDGKTCNQSDTILNVFALSYVSCAVQCTSTCGCVGFMYNQARRSCVGCRTQHKNGQDLLSDMGAQYFVGDWFDFEGTKYKLSKTKMSMDKVKDYCKRWGGKPARIDSDAKSVFLSGIQWAPNHVWIGLMQETEEDDWKWINDGNATTYTNWWSIGNSPQPDSVKWPACVAISKGFTYMWADKLCNSQLEVLCEKQRC